MSETTPFLKLLTGSFSTSAEENPKNEGHISLAFFYQVQILANGKL